MSFFNTIKEYIDSKFEEKYKIIETTQNILIENQNKSNDDLNSKINDVFEENKKLRNEIISLKNDIIIYDNGSHNIGIYPRFFTLNTDTIYINKLFDIPLATHIINFNLEIIKKLTNLKYIKLRHECEWQDYTNNDYLRLFVIHIHYFNINKNDKVIENIEIIDLLTFCHLFNYTLLNTKAHNINLNEFYLHNTNKGYMYGSHTDDKQYFRIRDKSSTFPEYINNLKIAFEI
jgi:hypothetical protein